MKKGRRAINIAYLQFFLFSGLIASCQTNTPKPNTVVESVVDEITTRDSIVISSGEKDTSTFVYSWKSKYSTTQSLMNVIKPPIGYRRAVSDENSFDAWLKHLPLSNSNTVYLFNGEEKYNQSAQFKVLDIDVGKKDLQQCADAVMRLRAEYLYASNQYSKIHFKYTNGVNIPFLKWSNGFYPSLKGNKVVWTPSSNNKSYPSFKKYMKNVFMFAGTASLEKELKAVSLSDIQAGDVFIKGGFPGHAVIVLDVVLNIETNDKVFLLAQSYMPAQNIHILKNHNNLNLNPWYSLKEINEVVETPEWTFYSNQLKRFVE